MGREARDCCWTAVWLCLLFSASASAGVLTVDVLSTETGATLPGYVANDVLLDFDSMLFGQQLSLQLDKGTIFQSTSGSNYTAPSELIQGFYPQSEYDSFVTMGGVTAETSAPVITVGGAVDLAWRFNTSVSKSVRFDNTIADITWSAAPGTRIVAGEDFLTARLTLSSDAQGTFRYLASAAGDGDFWVGEAQVVDGTIGQLTRRLLPPVDPAVPPKPTTPNVPPIEQLEVPQIADPPVDQEPILDDPLPEAPVEIPSIDIVRNPLGEGTSGGWIPPTFVLPPKQVSIDLTKIEFFRDLYLVDYMTDETLVGAGIEAAIDANHFELLTSRPVVRGGGVAISDGWTEFSLQSLSDAAYLMSSAAGNASVPEPSTLCYSVVIAVLVVRSGRRGLR